ncbi:MAG TPA: MBL fold metallo-hydrolase [Vicinamibacterales bacterium]|nr:MBL fold metallo-hydrolase [Vicinamibacterales bacterium]
MRRSISLLFILAIFLMPSPTLIAQAQAGKTLDIYFIDTEGGQATLYVSPTGQTLLVDTGNAGERDLNRILEVLKAAGVKQIDHLWITHYHSDHYGSLFDIAKQVPIKRLYDHGESVEGDRPNIQQFQAAYAELTKTIPRTSVKPGEKLALTGTDTTVVMSNGHPLTAPIAKAPGAGRPNALCASHKERDELKTSENDQSAGFVMNYGRFRTINLGDLTRNGEFKLMCPANNIGTVDLYLTNHHGLDQSGAPVLVHAIQPRVAVMNNGTRKGGAVQTFQTLESLPGFDDVWQLHWSYAGSVEHNAPGLMIANIDAPDQLAAIVGMTPGTQPAVPPPAGPGGNVAHAPAHYLKVSARTDGSFTVTNSRNGYSKTYPARP